MLAKYAGTTAGKELHTWPAGWLACLAGLGLDLRGLKLVFVSKKGC